MARTTTGDVVAVQPGNNIYTVLVIAAFLATLLALIVVIARGRAMDVAFW